MEEDDPSAPLALSLLAIQVGAERLAFTASTDDLRGAELDLLDGVTLAGLAVRWLG